jgi:hypothetical protein
MTDEATPKLEYGQPETQYGLTFDHQPDGGVVITVPGTGGRYLRRRLSGLHNGAAMLSVVVAFAFGKLRGRPTPPRAILSLTPDIFSVLEPASGLSYETVVSAWFVKEVGELRANRYSKGVYVRIPARENFDLLTDLPRKMGERIGQVLEGTLRRVRQ